MRHRASLVCSASLLALMCTSAGHSQTRPRRVIAVTAERFAFTPSEITIDAGEEVELHLKSDDTAHGFRVAGVVNVAVPKRGHGALTVLVGPLAAGRYPFECSRVCGAGHHSMRGTLVVRENPVGTAR